MTTYTVFGEIRFNVNLDFDHEPTEDEIVDVLNSRIDDCLNMSSGIEVLAYGPRSDVSAK